jgi:hypothetical protein
LNEFEKRVSYAWFFSSKAEITSSGSDHARDRWTHTTDGRGTHLKDRGKREDRFTRKTAHARKIMTVGVYLSWLLSVCIGDKDLDFSSQIRADGGYDNR